MTQTARAQKYEMDQASAPSPFSLVGERALITGGGTGLGLNIARCMVRAGAQVTLVGRREQPLSDAVAELGEMATYEPCDVTDVDAVSRMLDRVSDQGGVSILVNNAGVHLKKDAISMSVDDFQAVMQTHVVAAFDLTRQVLPGMLRRQHGSVLFIASMASFIGMPQVCAYSAAKSAYLGMVRSLTAEVASSNVRVNAIAPGWIESPMLREALDGDQERANKILSRTPMGRFGKPDDVGHAAVYLCSDAARFVTGVVLPIDGGASTGF